MHTFDSRRELHITTQALLTAKAAINHTANDGATALDCAVQVSV